MKKTEKTTVRHKSGGISFIMAVLCIAVVIVGVLCITRFYEINARKERLLQERHELEEQKQALKDKRNQIIAQGTHGSDSVYVERVAREQLDMVYPGEVIFRTTGE